MFQNVSIAKCMGCIVYTLFRRNYCFFAYKLKKNSFNLHAKNYISQVRDLNVVTNHNALFINLWVWQVRNYVRCAIANANLLFTLKLKIRNMLKNLQNYKKHEHTDAVYGYQWKILINNNIKVEDGISEKGNKQNKPNKIIT